MAALNKLTDQNELAKIAKSGVKYVHTVIRNRERDAGDYEEQRFVTDLRINAVDKLNDFGLLADVAKNAADESVREAAEKKLL